MAKKNSAASQTSAGKDAIFNKPSQPQSAEEARVWNALDRARQVAKQQIKKELESEIVGADILNLKLKE